MRLEGLKQLAWTMVTQRRREILSDDEKLLGDGNLRALAKEGIRIVRPVGATHEFRHDQMRAFLAALWLFEETPNLPALEKFASIRESGDRWRGLRTEPPRPRGTLAIPRSAADLSGRPKRAMALRKRRSRSTRDPTCRFTGGSRRT
jgi:hypothetical protein